MPGLERKKATLGRTGGGIDAGRYDRQELVKKGAVLQRIGRYIKREGRHSKITWFEYLANT